MLSERSDDRYYVSVPTNYVRPPRVSEFEHATWLRMLKSAYDTQVDVSSVSGIIGFAGPAEVGKDTMVRLLAGYLSLVGAQENMPNSLFKTLHDSFAAPIYAAIAVMTGIPEYVLSDRRYKDMPITWPGAPKGLENWTPRKLLKWLGTECTRNQVCGTFWVDRFHERSKAWLKPSGQDDDKVKGRVIFLSDVRHENEVDCCDLVIELEREGITYTGDHSSAVRLPDECIDVTATIAEDTDYFDLCGKIMTMLVNNVHVKKAGAVAKRSQA